MSSDKAGLSDLPSSAQRTAGPRKLIAMFGGSTVVLYFAPSPAETNAKNRMLQLPRDGKLGDADPNVAMVKGWIRACNAHDELVTLLARAEIAIPNHARNEALLLDLRAALAKLS